MEYNEKREKILTYLLFIATMAMATIVGGAYALIVIAIFR